MTFIEVAGLVVILVTAGVMTAYRIKIANSSQPEFRTIPAFTHLKKAIGLAVENGTRIHISLGKSSLTQPTSPSALAGLATLERIGHFASVRSEERRVGKECR